MSIKGLTKIVSISLLPVLTGCAGFDRLATITQAPPLSAIENPVKQVGYKPVSLPMPRTEHAAYSPNSLWRTGARAFFKDQRAHQIGDSLLELLDGRASVGEPPPVEDVVDAFLKHTGCGELGATSPDGKFTVIEVECLGACGFPTVVMINNEFIESVTAEKVPEIVGRYK